MRKIQILVSISIFAAPCKSLLPTLGRSVNLSEPWAPRKDTSQSLLHFLQTCCKTLSKFKLLDIDIELLALECGAPPGGRSKALSVEGAQRPSGLRGRRPSK